MRLTALAALGLACSLACGWGPIPEPDGAVVTLPSPNADAGAGAPRSATDVTRPAIGRGRTAASPPGTADAPPEPASSTESPPAAPPDAVVALDRAALERSFGEASGVGDVIGLRPRLTLRGVDGIVVTGVPAGSPLAPLDLREGDVIRSVNGRRLSSLDAAVEIGQGLADASVIDAEIVRDGKTRRLRVALR